MLERCILLIEDDPDVMHVLERFLVGRDWSVTSVRSGEDAVETMSRERPDVILMDLNLPDRTGFELMVELQQIQPDAAIIVITGETEISTAVEAMRRGAESFIAKPLSLAHLEATVERAFEKVQLRYRSRRSSVRRPDLEDWTFQEAPAMQDLGRRIELVAGSDTTVLLLGETGVGKGWVSERIHELSERRAGAFVETNCAGLSATFLDSELFGHEKGAFTDAKNMKPGLFEVAHRGTLFLDEIGDLATELQPKLLKALEKRQFRRLGATRETHVDVRLIAATNKNLQEEVQAGRFREDLYYRLAVMPIHIPPLRERGATGIAELARLIFADLRGRLASGATSITSETLEYMCRYAWPGNVRELRNVLERALILAGDAVELQPGHLPVEITRGDRSTSGLHDLDLTLEELERLHIGRVLEHYQGNRSQAAKSLGIARNTLYEKLRKYELEDVSRS